MTTLQRHSIAAALCLGLLACGGSSESATPQAAPGMRITVQNTSLNAPWSMAWLPNGDMLVTEKQGQLKRLNSDGSQVLATVQGLPEVVSTGQGGLMAVLPSPSFASDSEIFLTYSEPGVGTEAGLAGTAVLRAKLQQDRLMDAQVIYRQVPKVSGSGHFGARLAFDRSGQLFVSLGERQKESPAQDLGTSLGKIVRIQRNGQPAIGNPTWGTGARPEIWSYGHRNPQGLAVHPDTGELWVVEHGPQGGDEINRVLAGGNFGWPKVSYGCPYGSPVGDACRIGGGTHAPAYTEPVATWTPISIAPSSLLIYTGSGFPQWRGHLFVSALAGQNVSRMVLQDGREVSRDQPLGQLKDRIRHINQGPDGWLYVLTDSGKLMRISQ